MATILLTILGLCLFEVICSIDNAIINAEVLSTMQPKYRKWFLIWGIIIAVFLVRGLLPWLIIFVSSPELGFIGSLTSTFSNDPHVKEIIEASAPILLIGGGIFLIFLFCHWLFLEEKNYGLKWERFFHSKGIWFYTVISILLTIIIWYALKAPNKMMVLGAMIGSTAFFITHGFKQSAEESEKKLMNKGMSDISKILYLEVLDATFSIDGVLGAFAFTLSVPLILLGNGIGAIVVRQITVSNIENIKKYKYLKNGAMYSILFLGIIMTLNSFDIDMPEYTAPLITFIIVGYFFYRSTLEIKTKNKNN